MANQPSSSSNRTSRALQPVAPEPSRQLAMPAAVRPGQASIENTITPSFLWWVFQQWWKVGIPVGLILAAVTGALIIYFYIPRYEAKSQLMIEDSGLFIAFNNAASSNQSQRYIQTQLELLKSAVVLEPALSRSEVAAVKELKESPNPLEILRKNLTVSSSGRSDLYYISYISTVPSDAAAIVNAVVDEYMLFNTRDDADRTRKVIDILEDERLRRGVEVERLRTQLVDLSEEVTGKDPYSGSTTDFTLSSNPLGALFQSLTQLDLDRAMLRAQKQFLAESKDDEHDPLESSGLLKMQVDSQAETQQREAAIADVKAQMEEVKADALKWRKDPQWQSSPSYVALQKELEQRQADLEEFKTKLTDDDFGTTPRGAETRPRAGNGQDRSAAGGFGRAREIAHGAIQ